MDYFDATGKSIRKHLYDEISAQGARLTCMV